MADHKGLQVEYQLRVAGKLLVLDLQEGVVHMIQGLVVLLAVVVAVEECLDNCLEVEAHFLGMRHIVALLVDHNLSLAGIDYQGLHTLDCGLQEQGIQVGHTVKEIFGIKYFTIKVIQICLTINKG